MKDYNLLHAKMTDYMDMPQWFVDEGEQLRLHYNFMILILEEMNKQNMSKKQLAIRLDVTKKYVKQLFNGERLLDLSLIVKLQNIFNVQFKIAFK